ncbi:hypothetical protein ABPG75_013069 [Micractinium tetrahymenae]
MKNHRNELLRTLKRAIKQIMGPEAMGVEAPVCATDKFKVNLAHQALLLVVLVAIRVAAATGEPPPLLLTAQRRCRPPRPGERLPALELVSQWGEPPANNHTVTLISQLSLDRLDKLENQCRTWPLPLAAAVYVPSQYGILLGRQPGEPPMLVSAVAEQLSQFHARMQQAGRCHLQLALYKEDLWGDDVALALMYPFNAMRNRVLQLASTQAVLAADVDLLVGSAEELGSSEGWAALRPWLETGAGVVLPAFETPFDVTGRVKLPHPEEVGRAAAFRAVSGGKAGAVESFHNGSLLIVKAKEEPRASSAAQYERWIAGEDFYPIPFEANYEPYIIANRTLLPWYDEQYRGPAFDKVTHARCFKYWGGSYAVHPRAFLVHVPHERSATYHTAYANNWEKGRKYGALYWQFQKDLAAGTYAPVTSFAAERCDLPLPALEAQQQQGKEEL